MSSSVSRSGIVVVAAALAVTGLSAREFRAMWRTDEIRPGAGVTHVGRLSDTLPTLAGTPGDTPVYTLAAPAGAAPGGTALVLGGTHADEPAGYLAAVALVETATVTAGRLIVIPRANASGFTYNVPQEGHPQRFEIATPRGPRVFTFGARATNPVHQWPDPQVHTLRGSGQALSGSETRNLNRAYPGRADGSLTEQIAFAITTLIREERVDLAIDLHEAAPEYPVVNTIVAHERATDLAALVNVNLSGGGIAIGLEPSPKTLHGLSHREWGDSTPALAVLMETANPSQGRLRGKTDAALVVTGRDRYFLAAARRRRLNVPFDESGWPLDLRVARHLAGVTQFVSDLGLLDEAKGITVTGVPGYDDIVSRGLGAYLR
ncbi:MAG TPA: succinylglutamate desuccinylase/aspartoacylase family protein [Thermoanaerobaculia bacterium]|nr:succinylglutamate desuccinylase/aspartoacylase family protein [Thermoanaerobaculia bacterium]